MSWLSKIVKKVKKPLLGAVRLGLSSATGGVSERVIGAVGAVKKAAQIRGINKKLSELPAVKLAESKYTLPTPTKSVSVSATTMPGGAKLKGSAPKPRAKKARVTKAAKKASSGRKTPSGAKRKPPTGGLNLKALSASWRAAGKPGSWQQWIKDHK